MGTTGTVRPFSAIDNFVQGSRVANCSLHSIGLCRSNSSKVSVLRMRNNRLLNRFTRAPGR